MDRLNKETEILHQLDCMENLLVRVSRQQEGILFTLNQLHTEHSGMLREDAGMMSVLMERIDDLEALIRRKLASKKRRHFE